MYAGIENPSPLVLTKVKNVFNVMMKKELGNGYKEDVQSLLRVTKR